MSSFLAETRESLPAPEAPAERPGTAAPQTTAALIARLELERDEARADRNRLQIELNVRNCALDATKSFFIILDMNQRGSPIVYVNRALAEAHGYSTDELLGRGALTLIAREECASQVQAVIKAIQGGGIARTELRARRRDGSVFSAGIFVGPVSDATGTITHYVVVGSDITNRERMASELRLAQKLEAVGQLAAGIAHEINTPVQYVGDSLYFLQTASRDIEELLEIYRREVGSLPPRGALIAARQRLREAEERMDLQFLREEYPKAFDRALDGVARVTHIVRAIKEFAHPDQQEQKAADLNHAIETTLTVARNEYKYCASVETRFGDLPEVCCNIGELNQVFVNLIVNAAHAIQDSGKDTNTGRILIVTEVSGANVVVRISDNGCGIPPANLERIFDPFFTTKEVGKGTGQGLSIARTIVVERHGGRLDVTSTVGSGTEFAIRLPITGRGDTPCQ